MKVEDKIINSFVDFFVNNLEEDIEALKAKAFKKMIAKTEEILRMIRDNPDLSTKDAINALSYIMCNASIVDIDDMNTLTYEEAENYYNLVKSAHNEFDCIMTNIQNNINHLKNEIAHHKEEDEDLTKLSKEELIERLRRK